MGKKGGKGKGVSKGGGGDGGSAVKDAGYWKTKAGKREKAAQKQQAKLNITTGEGLLEEAIACGQTDTSTAKSKLAEARAEFQAVADSFGGVHLAALYNLGVCSQTSADLNNQNSEVEEAASFFRRAIAADTSKRGAAAGLAHANLGITILDHRARGGKPPGQVKSILVPHHIFSNLSISSLTSRYRNFSLKLGDAANNNNVARQFLCAGRHSTKKQSNTLL